MSRTERIDAKLVLALVCALSSACVTVPDRASPTEPAHLTLPSDLVGKQVELQLGQDNWRRGAEPSQTMEIFVDSYLDGTLIGRAPLGARVVVAWAHVHSYRVVVTERDDEFGWFGLLVAVASVGVFLGIVAGPPPDISIGPPT